MAVKADSDHLACVPLAGFAHLAIFHQFLKHFDFLFVVFPVRRIVDIKMIYLQQGIIFLFQIDDIVELTFISLFYRPIKRSV